MSSELGAALEAAVTRALSVLSKDEQLQSAIHALAQAVVRATQPPAQSVVCEPPVETLPAVSPPQIPRESPIQPTDGNHEFTQEALPFPTDRTPEKLPELTFGGIRSASAVPAYGGWANHSSDIDLSLVETRCKLKAEGARWAATRRQMMSQGAIYGIDIAPRQEELISRARAIPDCFLWMCHSSCPSPDDLNLFEHVAGCFENAAALLALLRQIREKPDLLRAEYEKCLDLLAEAQSSLRIGIENLGGLRDSDQTQIYLWLKFTGHESQIYIQRFMRLDDPGDPSRWPDLAARIEAADARVQECLKREKQRGKLLGKIRYKTSEILKSPESAADDWAGILECIDELAAGGLPPSNAELRDLLIPVHETLPASQELSKPVELVFREIDRHLATVAPPDITAPTALSPEVQSVARLLKGRAMVLIGGERRPASYEALKDAFQLQELIWIETREHESISGFEPYIARPDVAVVNLAIRWSSHSHGDAQLFCERYGKPLVRLPGGYNPNQVAAQILKQCSERLAAVV